MFIPLSIHKPSFILNRWGSCDSSFLYPIHLPTNFLSRKKSCFSQSQTIYVTASIGIPALTNPQQLRVTAARPGTVNFELDIQKEHTVCPLYTPIKPLVPTKSHQNRLGILHGGTIAGMGEATLNALQDNTQTNPKCSRLRGLSGGSIQGPIRYRRVYRFIW